MYIKEVIKRKFYWRSAAPRIPDRFAFLRSRFDIGTVCFTERACADPLGKLLLAALPAAQSEGNSLLVCTPEDHLTWRDCSFDHLLTVSDLFSILSAPKEKHRSFPQLFNTVENLYCRFYIIGNSSFAKETAEYLSENSAISVHTISPDAVAATQKDYTVNIESDADTVVIFADLCPVRPVLDQNGNPVIAMFSKPLFSAGTDSVNGTDDTLRNIVPRLLEAGIPVLKVYMPTPDRMPDQKRLKISIFFWHVLRKLNEDAFMRARNRARNTTYLAAEQAAVINDTSRGYSILFGNGKYINFDNGFRRTIGNTPDAARTLHVFGPCFVRGLSVEDELTIPSLLQKLIPADWNVRNHGSEFGTCNYIMRQTEFRKGDAVILFLLDSFDKHDHLTPAWDMNDTYRKVGKIHRHVDDDIAHFDLDIQKQLAVDLFDALQTYNMLQDESAENDSLTFGPAKKRAADIERFSEDPGLVEYLHGLQNAYPYREQSRGAIVMNCNPFTRGHRYLIETAAAKVDELFIFVVQENKSYFTFEQRFQMVTAGTAHLPNVHVIPSGIYMISSKTLPGYFEKAALTNAVVDASADLEYFVQLASALHISVRFAGNEPNDPFTRRYNENMQNFLPRYDIDFVEIDRIQHKALPISATNVRAAIENNDIHAVAAIVPETTLLYLIQYGYLKEDPAAV